MIPMIPQIARTFAAFALLLAPAVSLHASTDDVLQKSFEMSGPGRLVVEADGASLAVATWDKPQAEVTIKRTVSASDEKREKEILAEDKIAVDLKDGELTVTLDTPSGWGNRHARRGYRIEIRLPASCSAKLHTKGGSIDADGLAGGVEAVTGGGSVSLRHIGANAKAKTSGGSVQASDVAGDLFAHTSGGSVRIENVSGNIEAGTSGGSISIQGVRGAVSASTSGGGVSVRFVAQPAGPVMLETSGGSVNLTLPADTAAHIDAKTSGGRVQSDFPLSRPEHGSSHMWGDINGGGVAVNLSTSGGNIHITKAE
jgi:DUF4097 and DUF4098 domain-containing protein YvlB